MKKAFNGRLSEFIFGHRKYNMLNFMSILYVLFPGIFHTQLNWTNSGRLTFPLKIPCLDNVRKNIHCNNLPIIDKYHIISVTNSKVKLQLHSFTRCFTVDMIETRENNRNISNLKAKLFKQLFVS